MAEESSVIRIGVEQKQKLDEMADFMGLPSRTIVDVLIDFGYQHPVEMGQIVGEVFAARNSKRVVMAQGLNGPAVVEPEWGNQ